MPSTIVKLSSGHARAWAHNQPVWLTESGEVARPVTRAEQHAISRALERTSRINRSFRLDLLIEDVVATTSGFVRRRVPLGRKPGAPPTPQKITCAFEVQVVATKRTVTVWYGNLRYATGREVIAAEILAEHGECVMHGRNGKCIGVLRDPLVAEREPNYGRRVQYSRTREELQHAEEQLALRLEEAPVVSPVQQRKGQPLQRTRPGSRPVPRPSPRPTTRATAQPPARPAPVRAYSPDQCPNDCRGRRGAQAWSLATGALPPTDQEHHPVCKYARGWSATLRTPETTSVLYDLELGRVMRGAMPEEIAEADAAERTTTMRNITVAGRLYAVLTREEANLAALEARGESPELPPLPAIAEPSEAEVDEAAEPRSPAELESSMGPYEGEEPEPETEPEPIELSTAEDVDRYLNELDGYGNEKPTDPAPAFAEALDEPAVNSSAEERQDWPSLSEIQASPEDYRKRAEVTASQYLARSSGAHPPPSSHT